MNTSAIRSEQALVILVIDDDAVMRELLSLLFGAEGHMVLTAESGEAALDLLSILSSEQLPSVLLADLKMPGMSPQTLAMRLRVVCPPPALVLAMSASEPDSDEAADFDGFLRKPFSAADYKAALIRARARAATPPSSRAPEPPAKRGWDRRTPPVPTLDEVIYEKLSSVMGKKRLPQLYALFLDDAPTRVERMREAAAVNDAATFVSEAHAIKGGCGMLGATEIYSLAGRMETGGLSCSSWLDDFQPAFERLRRMLEERMNRQVDPQ